MYLTMKLENLFHIIAIIFLTSQGCGFAEDEKTANTGVRIGLSLDSSSVELQNIPSYGIEEFKSVSLGTEQWKDFFAVYEEPSDKEMRELKV